MFELNNVMQLASATGPWSNLARAVLAGWKALGAYDERVINLVEAGQRVTIRPGQENPAMDAGRVFIVEKKDGDFWQLRAHDGTGPHRWYKASDLLEVPAPKEKLMNAMETETQLHAAADRFEAAVNKRIARGERPDDALRGEAAADAVGAEVYRRSKTSSAAISSEPVTISLSARAGENFDALAMRYAHERGISLRQAVHEVGRAFPQLAQAR